MTVVTGKALVEGAEKAVKFGRDPNLDIFIMEVPHSRPLLRIDRRLYVMHMQTLIIGSTHSIPFLR
jgi:hypothetical protein